MKIKHRLEPANYVITTILQWLHLSSELISVFLGSPCSWMYFTRKMSKIIRF